MRCVHPMRACRDMWIIGLGDALTSIYAGCVVFATLGYMAHQTDRAIDEVVVKGVCTVATRHAHTRTGIGMAFVVYAEVISYLPVAPLWAILFFSMLIMLGLDTQVWAQLCSHANTSTDIRDRDNRDGRVRRVSGTVA